MTHHYFTVLQHFSQMSSPQTTPDSDLLPDVWNSVKHYESIVYAIEYALFCWQLLFMFSAKKQKLCNIKEQQQSRKCMAGRPAIIVNGKVQKNTTLKNREQFVYTHTHITRICLYEQQSAVQLSSGVVCVWVGSEGICWHKCSPFSDVLSDSDSVWLGSPFCHFCSWLTVDSRASPSALHCWPPLWVAWPFPLNAKVV